MAPMKTPDHRVPPRLLQKLCSKALAGCFASLKMLRDAMSIALYDLGQRATTKKRRFGNYSAHISTSAIPSWMANTLRGYPVTFPCNSRYLKGTGFLDVLCFKSMSIR